MRLVRVNIQVMIFIAAFLVGLCGLADSRFTSNRIINGKPVKIEEVPWTVGIGPVAGAIECGGVIIGEQYILTAAHCFREYGRQNLAASAKVQVSETSLYNKGDGQEIFSIESIKMHEKYNDQSLENDLCILKLTEKIKFSPKAKPVCLPKKDASFAGRSATIAGWGHRLEGIPSDGDILSIQVPIWDDSRCTKFEDIVISTMICAGEHKKDACQGDSGGPMTVLENGKNILVGIVSYGSGGCGSRTYPGVYTRVSAFIDWIKANAVVATDC